MAGFTTCEFCHKQIPAPHDCPERRRALVAQAQALGELDAAANEPTQKDAADED